MGRKKKSEVESTEQPVLKPRKTLSGPLRDKSRTMTRMIAAVGKVLQKRIPRTNSSQYCNCSWCR